MMKKTVFILLLTLFSFRYVMPLMARTNSRAQDRDVRKVDKKRQKAMKKYAKAQKKAERKMLKTERKNTKYPQHPF